MSADGAPGRDELLSELLAWLNRRLAPPGVLIVAATPLFAGGLINSIRVLDLIAWVEQAIGREIPDMEIRMDNFCTPERIAEAFGAAPALVGQRLGGGAAHVER